MLFFRSSDFIAGSIPITMCTVSVSYLLDQAISSLDLYLSLCVGCLLVNLFSKCISSFNSNLLYFILNIHICESRVYSGCAFLSVLQKGLLFLASRVLHVKTYGITHIFKILIKSFGKKRHLICC